MKHNNEAAESQLQYEIERDYSSRFDADEYLSNGYYLHFHRNFELYCVVKGEVYVTVSGEKMLLKDGQMAFVNGLEGHAYEVLEPAVIAFFHIGTNHVEPYIRLFQYKRPGRWLFDVEYNKKIYAIVREVIDRGAAMSELMRTGKACELLALIIERYGTNDGKLLYLGGEEISGIVQYIYDHCTEELTLKSVAEAFHMSPLVLSRKFSKYIKTDFRIFVNDVRVQEVMRRLNGEEGKTCSLMEIVYRCGFGSLATFYRTYKRNFHYPLRVEETT